MVQVHCCVTVHRNLKLTTTQICFSCSCQPSSRTSMVTFVSVTSTLCSIALDCCVIAQHNYTTNTTLVCILLYISFAVSVFFVRLQISWWQCRWSALKFAWWYISVTDTIPTLVIHHSFSLSLQAQNLPFQQILPTVDFFLPTGLPHDNGTGPDLLCSSFYF